MLCGLWDLSSPGIELRSSAVRAWWTARELPQWVYNMVTLFLWPVACLVPSHEIWKKRVQVSAVVSWRQVHGVYHPEGVPMIYPLRDASEHT